MSEAESTRRRILVTSALPYANGPIHIGHLVEYIQTDVWVRFQRMRGAEIHFVCADDAHGTPVMLSAEREGVSPEELIERIGAEHQADFAAFDISFDNYHTTHSPENRECSERIYRALREGRARGRAHHSAPLRPGARDVPAGPLRPGRVPPVRGGGPAWGRLRGVRGHLRDGRAPQPRSPWSRGARFLSSVTPSRSSSGSLTSTTCCGPGSGRSFRPPGEAERRRVQPEIANKLDEWLSAGLEDWDISRNAPYFGFEIPDRPGKYFYVWLDAPIGYMASFLNLCGRVRAQGGRAPLRGLLVRWTATAEVYHFIGKDIAYFHTLFWPACLHGSGLPDAERGLLPRVPHRER